MELEAIADKIIEHINQYIEFRKHYILIKPTFDNKDIKDTDYGHNHFMIRYQFIDQLYCSFDSNKFKLHLSATDGSSYTSNYDISSFIVQLSDSEIKKVIHIIQNKFMDKMTLFIDKSLDTLSEIHEKLEALVFAPDSAFFKEFMAAREKKQ